MASIIDGKSRWKTSLAAYYAGSMTLRAHEMKAIARPPSAIDTKSPPLKARINHGRLIVDCPDCGGAEYVWLNGPWVMLCQQCWNAATRGFWRLVEVPLEIGEIIEILSQRPLENQNWEPGETVEFLRQENADHGIGG